MAKNSDRSRVGQFKMLFLNNLRNVFKSKIQFIGLVILVFLTTLVYTVSSTTVDRVNASYNDFTSAEKSNQHDFVVDFSGTTLATFDSKQKSDKESVISVGDIEIRQELVLKYAQAYAKKEGIDLEIERVETRLFASESGTTIKAVALNPDQAIDKMQVIEGMPLEYWNDYANSLNDLTKKWVYLSERFAKKNDIKVNDIVRLQDDKYGTSIKVIDSKNKGVQKILNDNIGKDINMWLPESDYANLNWFRVVGFGASADMAAPIVDISSPLPNAKKETLAYVSPKAFGLKYMNFNSSDYNNKDLLGSNPKIWVKTSDSLKEETLKISSSADKELYFVGKFRDRDADFIKESITKINDWINSEDGAKNIGLDGYFVKTSNSSLPVLMAKDDSRYQYARRTTFLESAVTAYQGVCTIIMLVVLIISIIVLMSMIKKLIERTAGQNGVLRSLGYSRKYIIGAYFVYPLMIALIGGIVGFVTGLMLQMPIMHRFENYFNIVYKGFTLDISSLLISIFGIFAILLITTLITAAVLMRMTPLEMINFQNASSSNKFKQTLKKIFTVRKNFNARFMGALLSNSMGKLGAVSITMLISTVLITTSTAIPAILKNDVEYSYKGSDYESKMEYYSPVYNNPMSFYKTYNPNLNGVKSKTFKEFKYTDDAKEQNEYYKLGAKGTLFSTNVDNLLKDLSKGAINPDFFAPLFDATSLNNLIYKNTTTNYLKAQNISNSLAGEGEDQISPIIIKSVWQDYENYDLDSLKYASDFVAMFSDQQKAQSNSAVANKLRNFYIQYRNSLGLDEKLRKNTDEEVKFIKSTEGDNQPLEYLNYKNEGSNTDKNPLITEEYFVKGTESMDTQKYNHLTKDGKFDSDIDSLIVNTDFAYQIKNAPTTYNEGIRPLIYGLYNWTRAFFVNNLSQAFTQGIYTKSPYMVRTQIEKAFEKNTNFSTGFGLTTFDPLNGKEELGTYFNASYKDVGFKVYGLKNDKFESLVQDGNVITNKLFDKGNENGLIINQTLSKLLNLNNGDVIKLNSVKNTLEINGQEAKFDSWSGKNLNAYVEAGISSKTDGLNSENTNQKYLNNNLTQKDKGWLYNNEELFESSISMKPGTTPVSPTKIETLAKDGQAIISSKIEKDVEYKIIGVADQYGDSKAWINNDTAEKVLNFDKTKPLLFRMFLEEWKKPFGINADNLEFVNEIQNLRAQIKEDNYDEYSKAYNDFLKWTNTSKNKKYLRVFNYEYPVFNYKMSKSDTIDDVEKGVSTAQIFGDYTAYGIQGGTIGSGEKPETYPGFQTATIENANVISIAKDVKKTIYGVINAALYSIIGVAVLMSFMIIMLTINVVISENTRIIATMKVLGYRNRYITRLVLGMYIPVVVVTTLMGFGIGWGFLTLTNNILIGSGMVMPFVFEWWMPVLSIGVGWLLYSISLGISWIVMKRVSILVAVQAS